MTFKTTALLVLLVALMIAFVAAANSNEKEQKDVNAADDNKDTADRDLDHLRAVNKDTADREKASVVDVDGETVELPPGHPTCPGGKCTEEMRSKCPYTRSKRAVNGVLETILAVAKDPLCKGVELAIIAMENDSCRRIALVVGTIVFAWAFSKTLSVNAVVRRREDAAKP